MIERHVITDRDQWLALRRADMTASQVASLLGVHPHLSAYEAWAIKSGRISGEVEDNPMLRRGRLLEPVAVQMIAEDFPEWRLTPPGAYYRDPAARLGATPDLFVERQDRPGRGVCQIKTCAESVFREKWTDPDTRETVPPLWIAAQAITEAHLTGAHWAMVAALVITWAGALDLRIVEVPVHERLIARIRSAVEDFWRRVASGEAYDPDYGRDAALVMRLNSPDEDAPPRDLRDDTELGAWLADRERLVTIAKAGDDATKARREIDARMVKEKFGNSPRILAPDGSVITRKTIQTKSYTVEARSTDRIFIKRKAA